MPIDPSIPFRALAGGQQHQINPLGMLSDVLQVQQQRESLKYLQGRTYDDEQERAKTAREAQADARVRELFKQNIDNPEDALVQAAREGLAPEALTMAKQLGGARHELALGTHQQLQAEEQMYKVIGQRAQAVNDQASNDEFNAFVLDKDPNLQPLLSPQYDPATIARFQKLVQSGSEFATGQRQGLESVLEGKHQRGYGESMMYAPNQAAWDAVRDGHRALGTPKYIIDLLPEQWSPEAQAKARQMAIAPKNDSTGGEESAEKEALDAYAKSLGKASRSELTYAERLKFRKGYGQADDRARVTGGGAGVAGGGETLTPDAIDLIATQVRMLGNKGMPTRFDKDQKNKIYNVVAGQARTLGQSPAVMIQKQAAYSADSKALDLMRKMQSGAVASESKASQQANIIRELSAQVPRTEWPLLNKAIVDGKTELLGDKNAKLLANAIITFTSEYGKIVEGSTGSTAGSSDSARRASDKLINAYLSKGTMAGVLDLMEREMGLTNVGYDVAIREITERQTGQPYGTQPAAAPAPAPAPTAPPPAPGTKVRRWNATTQQLEYVTVPKE